MKSRSSGSDPLSAALRLLGFRDRSTGEIRLRLKEKGFDPESIEAALERCRELGYLDDARFARERARSLLASGRGVGSRILADLAARGIGEEEARIALDAADDEFPAEDLLRNLVNRRYPGFDFVAASEKERRRVVNFLLRRGFSLSLVLSILKEER